MIEVRVVRLSLNLPCTHAQKVDLWLIQHLALLIACECMAVGLQGLRGGQGGGCAATALLY